MFELNWNNDDDSLINFYHTFYLTKENKRTHNSNEASYCIKGAWDHNSEYDNIKNNLNYLEDCTVLDIGCQEGFFTFLFDDLGADVTSMDCYDKITRRFTWKLFNYEGKFIHENIYQLANNSYDTYDYVWLSDVLVHLENPLYALENIRKVANKGILLAIDACPDITPIESIWKDYNQKNKALPLMYQPITNDEESIYFWLIPSETVISILGRFFNDPRMIFSYDTGGNRRVNVFLAEIDSSFKEKGFLELDWKRED